MCSMKLQLLVLLPIEQKPELLLLLHNLANCYFKKKVPFLAVDFTSRFQVEGDSCQLVFVAFTFFGTLFPVQAGFDKVPYVSAPILAKSGLGQIGQGSFLSPAPRPPSG